VNLAAAEAHETLRPFLPLAESLGRLYGSLVGELPATVEIAVEGDIGAYDTRIVGLSVLKGVFGRISDQPVTYVNAPQRAKDHGVEVREVSSTSSADYVNLITIDGGGHTVSGTLAGRRSEHRIVGLDGHTFDVPPADHMLMVTNDDRPGVIGTVGTILGNAGVNIADMDVGRAEDTGTAVMLIAPTSVVPPDVVTALRTAPGILSVATLTA
jgi:D-3-phosphoglycerate dehydrogenase